GVHRRLPPRGAGEGEAAAAAAAATAAEPSGDERQRACPIRETAAATAPCFRVAACRTAQLDAPSKRPSRTTTAAQAGQGRGAAGLESFGTSSASPSVAE